MRVIVFSSQRSPVLVPLLKAGLSIVGVVAYGAEVVEQAGRLRRMMFGIRQIFNSDTVNPISFARKQQIPVYHASCMADPGLEEWLSELPHDVLLVYCVPVIPANLYSHCRYAINLHPSLLPAYRGGHPLLWAVWDGCEQAGCSVHLLAETADAGDIIVQKAFVIPDGVSEKSLERYAEVDIGVPLLLEAVERLARGDQLQPQPQPAESPTIYAKRKPAEQLWHEIPFEQWSIDRLWRFLRFTGVSPFKGLLEPEGLREWVVAKVERKPGEGEAGSLQHDFRGFYISHKVGRIRLQRPLRLRRVVKWLLRI